MIVKLPYGEGTRAVDLRGLRVRPLGPTLPRAVGSAGELVAAALDRPLDRPPLVELARGRRQAVVVVPDATRKVGLPEIMPVVARRLERAGLGGDRVTVLVACGTHPPAGGTAASHLVGELPPGARVVEHDARDEAALVTVGSTPAGRTIRLNRLAVEADLLVTVGGVRHHYFAGFGGGPKMVFPGIAGYEEIQANHAAVLLAEGGEPRRHPRCEPGVLDGNPVAEEIAAAADLHPPSLALCLVPDPGGRPARAVAGSWQGAFSAAVELVRAAYEVPAGRYPLVVASGGGAPSDTTLIQAHKALDAACRFASPGGEILLVARIDGGPGSPEMAPFLADPRPEAILRRLARRWVQYGHTTLRIVARTGAHRVHLCSELPPEDAVRLGFVPVADPAEVVEQWRERQPGQSVGLIAATPVYPARRA